VDSQKYFSNNIFVSHIFSVVCVPFSNNFNRFLFQLQLSIGTIISHPKNFKLFKLFLTRESETSEIKSQQEHGYHMVS